MHTTAALSQPSSQPASAPEQMPPDGHFQHKSYGKNLYEGPLTAAPLPPHATVADAAQSMHQDGYVIFPSLLSRDTVADMRAWIDRQGGDDAQYDHPKWCFNKHVSPRFHQTPEGLPLITQSPVLDTMRAVLGNDCQCIGGSLWITGPGRAMGLHIDYQPITLPEDVIADPRVIVPIHVATAHYYLDDVTLDYGPTTLIPGSHRAGRPPNHETSWNGRVPQAAIVPAGSCLLFRSDLWHAGSKNSGPNRRYMIQLHYANIYVQSKTVSVKERDKWSDASWNALTPDHHAVFGSPAESGRGSYIAHEHHQFDRV